ncbi:MAG TPA: right-handed parallel beta-helix repeat-containing protein [Desulfitobacteriaceae bacterium]|nr:right-handed parallel beta-helix repeat-containing protein [Desulfitobacteriaceae bacterium]
MFLTNNEILKTGSRPGRAMDSTFNLALIIILVICLFPNSRLPQPEGGSDYTALLKASFLNPPSLELSPNISISAPLTDSLLIDPAAVDPVFADSPQFSAADFGVTGDGTTSTSAALAALIKNVPAGSTVNFEAGKIYLLTEPLTLTKAINLDLMGSTVIAQNSDSVFHVQSDNVIIKNGILDLNYTTHNGIKASGEHESFPGVTGSALPGTNNLSLSAVPVGISEMKYLTIAGLAGYFKITALNGNVLTLDHPVPAAVSNSALNWCNPYSNVYFQKLHIKDLIPTALNLEGGIYLSNCENVHIDQCNFSNIFNPADAGDVDHSPAIKVADSCNIYINDIAAADGGVGINFFSVINAYVNRVSLSNLADNGFYLQAYSDNINIDNFVIDGVEEGIVFDTNNMAGTADGIPTIKISNGDIRHATNHGFTLRQGSSFYVNNVRFTECWNNIAQSGSYAGCSDAVFDNITCLNTAANAPIYLGNDKNLTFSNLTLQGFSAKDEAGRTRYADGLNIKAGCQNIQFHGVNIIGDNLNLQNGIVVSDNASDILIEGIISGYTDHDILNESSGTGLVSRISGTALYDS